MRLLLDAIEIVNSAVKRYAGVWKYHGMVEVLALKIHIVDSRQQNEVLGYLAIVATPSKSLVLRQRPVSFMSTALSRLEMATKYRYERLDSSTEHPLS